jgi:hypothetical protein
MEARASAFRGQAQLLGDLVRRQIQSEAQGEEFSIWSRQPR